LPLIPHLGALTVMTFCRLDPYLFGEFATGRSARFPQHMASLRPARQNRAFRPVLTAGFRFNYPFPEEPCHAQTLSS
jgi:hypothetical protein